MRVISVGSLPPRSGGPAHGGVATFHASLLEGLVSAENEVSLIGVVPNAPLDRDIGAPVLTRSAETPTAAFYEDLLERLRPDAVLMNHFANTIGVTHARLDPGAAAVGIAHSWHSVTLRDGAERARATETAAEAIGGLDALVAVSEHCLREGEALGFSYPSVAQAIHLPLQSFYADPQIEVAGQARSGVAHLGSLIPRKRPLALAEATALLPGVEVCFAGHGELEGDLRARIESLGIGRRARIAQLADPEARELLLRSEVMCMPSSSETFGLAYIEALACGTPVVGFGPTFREIREAMGIEIGEPLDGGGPAAIAAAIERVLAAEWDREELRRATLDTFSLDRVTDRYVDLLHRVVSKPAGPRVERGV